MQQPPRPDPAHHPRPWLAPLLVAFLALILRGLHLAQLNRHPLLEFPVGDALAYDQWARRIAAGDWLGRDVFYQAPLYPYTLGAIYAFTGSSPTAARLIQAAMGAIAAALLCAAGRRLFSPAVGLVAGLIMAAYPAAIFNDALLQKSALDNLLTCTLLYLLARAWTPAPRAEPEPAPAAADPEATASPLLWLGVGVVAAGLALTRENALILLPVLLAGALLAPGRASSPRRVLRVGALLLGVTLLLTPVALRNQAMGGQFLLTTSQLGPNFYIGNNPHASGSYMPLRPGRGTAVFERTDATELAQAAVGRALSPAEVSSYWLDRSLRFIGQEPGRWLALLGRKALLLVNRLEMVDTDSQTIHARFSLVLLVGDTLLNFGLLLALAAAGLALHLGDWRRHWIFYALAAAYAGGVIAFYVVARYRFPLVPMLAIWAAAAVVEAGRLLERCRRGASSVPAHDPAPRPLALAAAAGAAAAALALAWAPVVSPAEELASGEYNFGRLLLDRRDDPRAALPHLVRAAQLTPEFAEAHDALGMAMLRLAGPELARPSFGEAVRLNPQFREARLRLAQTLVELGDLPGAAGHFEAALRDDPLDAGTHVNLGAVLLRLGRHREAILHSREAIRLDPAGDDAYFNLGLALHAQGDLPGAADALGAALRLRPDNVAAMAALSMVQERQGQTEAAIATLRAALRLSPDDASLRQRLARLTTSAASGAPGAAGPVGAPARDRGGEPRPDASP